MAEMPNSTPFSSGTTPSLAHAPGDHDDALRVGATINGFEILRVLGVGGFGVVYLARDHTLEREVALKEYLPSALAGRRQDGMVTVRSSVNAETFTLGMRSFINEARLLAQFDHPSLVKVHRFWEGNGTAYMVMPYYRGHTLRQLRGSLAAAPDDKWLRGALTALLGALELLHAQGVYHRDVSPDNVLVTQEGRPVLLDFGAARRVLHGDTQNLTAILKPSFAPIEQYADASQLKQGPWTDLYALAATAYTLLTGQAPVPATARALHDELPLLAEIKPPGYSMPLLQALDWALAVRPQDRPQTAAQMRDALQGLIACPPPVRHDLTVRGALNALDPSLAPIAASGGQGSLREIDIPLDDVALPNEPMVAGPASQERETLAGAPQILSDVRHPPLPQAKRRSWLFLPVALALAGGAAVLWLKQGREDTAARVAVEAAKPAPSARPGANDAQEVGVPSAAVSPAASAPMAPAPGTTAPVLPQPAAAQRGESPPAMVTPQPPTPRPSITPAVRAPSAEPATPFRAPRAPVPVAKARQPKEEIIIDERPPVTPRDICGTQALFAVHLCMKTECEKPRYSSHPQCVEFRSQPLPLAVPQPE